MKITGTNSAVIRGVDANVVVARVSVTDGTGFHINGAPTNASIDMRVRVLTALRNSGYGPATNKIDVELSTDTPSASLDLAIAVAVVLPNRRPIHATLIVGELALSGDILPVRGVLPIVLEARRSGFERVIVPAQNAAEGAIVSGIQVFGARTFVDAMEIYTGVSDVKPAEPVAPAPVNEDFNWSDVAGLESAKRGLEIAAAGGHNVLLVGPPGAGKTMLARRVTGVLPPLTFEEALETTSIWSVAGRTKPHQGLLAAPPFRAPHHTISVPGLSGGGAPLRPGEVSLAHNGVLFLDELPEFSRGALEALRQPLEEDEVTLVRAQGSFTLPARFMLIGAMNPCPCGHALDVDSKRCRCTAVGKSSYERRVAPLRSRFDLKIEVIGTPKSAVKGESSGTVRQRVIAARLRRKERGIGGPADIRSVARTIADLDGSETIRASHTDEAERYRR